jgi:hypothetical protein
VVVASREALVTDPSPLVSRLRSRRIEGRLVGPAYVEYVYAEERLAAIRQRLAAAPSPANTDARPVSYSYAAVIWLSRFLPSLAYTAPGGLFGQGRETAAGPIALMVAVMTLLLARRSSACRRAALVGLAGFVGMAGESVLILHYQSARGALFQDLGVLITSFMAGLALGSWGLHHFHEASTPSYAPGRPRGAILLGAFGALNLVVAVEVRTGALATLPGVAGLLLGSGLLVGAILAHASLAGVVDGASVVSPLYAADLLGGSLGGLAASLVFIPAFGLEATAGGMALLTLAAGLLL